jgi:hypothetical protein
MCGRTIRDLRPIKVSESMTMDQLKGLFKQAGIDHSAYRSLNPDIAFVPRKPSDPDVLPELCLGVADDDCESSALFAMQCKAAFVRLYVTLNSAQMNSGQLAAGSPGQALKTLCAGWKAFRKFTDASWDLMTRIVNRGGAMLHAGHLKTMTAVGLATNASAADVQANKADYCGHCFNLSYIKTPSMAVPKVGLLEGTAPMYMIRSHGKAPTATVRLFQGDKSEVKTIAHEDLLDKLGGTILGLTQVINKPNGGTQESRGWPLDVKVRGWLAKTMVMSALDSDPDVPLTFYNRVIFAGWPCTSDGQGCMPVTEAGKTVTAGCHPYQLNNMDVRGVSAALHPETVRRMADIMEEATPPMARESMLRDLANLWIPCRPLEHVNTEAVREPGVTYHRISTMESPCAPEYLSIVFEAKRRIAEETNRINGAKPNSDKIRLYAQLEGLSAVLCADVPYEDIAELTVVDSMKQALSNIGWPSYKP